MDSGTLAQRQNFRDETVLGNGWGTELEIKEIKQSRGKNMAVRMQPSARRQERRRWEVAHGRGESWELEWNSADSAEAQASRLASNSESSAALQSMKMGNALSTARSRHLAQYLVLGRHSINIC